MRPPLTIVEPPAVLRPDRRPGPGRSTAVWEVDGTLVRGDSLLPFLRRITGTAELARTLAAAARTPGSPRRTAVKARTLQRILGGRDRAGTDRIAREYAVAPAGRVRPDCLRRWQWHRGRGHRMLIASASLDLYLEPLGDLLGADAVICTRMETVNGRLTGRM